MTMRLALVFADGEVATVTAEPDGVRVRFAAAHVERDAEPGEARPVTGFAKGVSLFVAGADAPADLGALLGRVSSGRVRLQGSWATSIVLPFAVDADIALELAFANQTQLSLAGSALRCGFDGEPNFAESLFC